MSLHASDVLFLVCDFKFKIFVTLIIDKTQKIRLPLQLKLGLLSVGKRAFIAGVADDNGYGWAIAKSLAAAGAEILVGTWVPVSKLMITYIILFFNHRVI